MHLSDGEIKAYIDQETGADEVQRTEKHLATCSRCQERHQALLITSEQIQSNLSALEPAGKSHPIPASTARHRLHARFQEKELTMWNKLFSRKARPVWIGLAIVAILAISMTFAPVRAIANSFLGLFRVEQFTVVKINPADLPDQLGSSTQLEAMLSQDIQIEERGDHFSVPNKEQASLSAKFDVRLPAGMNQPLSILEVQPGGRVTFTVDAKRVQILLDEIGRADIQIPAGVDGATVKLDISDGVSAQYGDCRFDAETAAMEGFDPDNPTIPQLPRCTTLIQMPSPTISAPPGLNLTKIGEAYLQLLGMSRADAEKFAQKVDWTTTLVMPLPMYGTSYKEVQVDGVTGIIIEQDLDDHENQYILLWVKDGIVYALTGPGNQTTALAIARSLR